MFSRSLRKTPTLSEVDAVEAMPPAVTVLVRIGLSPLPDFPQFSTKKSLSIVTNNLYWGYRKRTLIVVRRQSQPEDSNWSGRHSQTGSDHEVLIPQYFAYKVFAFNILPGIHSITLNQVVKNQIFEGFQEKNNTIDI
jgi:hypothetical protein